MPTWHRLLSAADSACQAAKEAGRNRVHSFEENDIDLMRRRREMQVGRAINNTRLEEGPLRVVQADHSAAAAARDRLSLRAAAAHSRDEAGQRWSRRMNFMTAAERYGLNHPLASIRWVISKNCISLAGDPRPTRREKLCMCSINPVGTELGRR